jgi:hypothetical protein
MNLFGGHYSLDILVQNPMNVSRAPFLRVATQIRIPALVLALLLLMPADADSFFFPSGHKFNLFVLLRLAIRPTSSEGFPSAQTSVWRAKDNGKPQPSRQGVKLIALADRCVMNQF